MLNNIAVVPGKLPANMTKAVFFVNIEPQKQLCWKIPQMNAKFNFVFQTCAFCIRFKELNLQS